MKLLLDHNLSPNLIQRLVDLYDGSIHVRDVGLATATDEAVWNYAREHGFIIVSKDTDFHQRSFLYGHPPKVVWVRLGNCSTAAIEKLLRTERSRLSAFNDSKEGSFLVLGGDTKS